MEENDKVNLMSEGKEIQSCGQFTTSTSRVQTANANANINVNKLKPIALTKRKTRRSLNRTKEKDKLNFQFSDTNPVCTQLYLRAVKHGKKYRRMSCMELYSSPSPPPTPTPTPTPQENKRQLERRHKRNSQAQRIRDDDKYEDCRVRVHLIRELNRNTALHAQIRFLESRKDELRNFLFSYGYQLP